MKDLKVSIFTGHLYRKVVVLLFFFFSCFISHAQNYPTVKAQKGDGVYTLLKRHGLSPSKYMDQFIELNKSNLGPGNSLLVGRTYKLPVEKNSGTTSPEEKPAAGAKPSTAETKQPETKSSSSSGAKAASATYEIFGRNYQHVTRIDNELAGGVYYLVSGHGGPDPGAIGHFGKHVLCEDEYAYDVTLRLARCLLEHGAEVYIMVRDPNDGIRDESILAPDQDEYCYPNLAIPRSQLARLRQRTNVVNDLYVKNKNKVQRLIEIHVDSRSKGQNIDVFFYHNDGSSTGRKLAINLHQVFKEKYNYHQPGRGYKGTVSDRNLYMLKYSYPPAVLIELGNINHRRDQQRFMITDNRQAIANWLAEGLIRDIKNNK